MSTCQSKVAIIVLRYCNEDSYFSESFAGILEAVETLPDVDHVLQPFSCPGLEFPLVVDVVCNQGYSWIKVVARNAQALHLRWAGTLSTRRQTDL